MYAIVDIESTGSSTSHDGITEIAIVLHNGQEVDGVFETLVNPEVPIPPYVVGLTSITNAMVASAPKFEAVAEKIYALLQNRIFVAHNVSFDYNFIKHFLSKYNYELDVPYLCTLQLSRKAFPNFRKHGLASLAAALDIDLGKHHRAGGDAMATAKIFELILKSGGEMLVKKLIVTDNKKKFVKIKKRATQVGLAH